MTKIYEKTALLDEERRRIARRYLAESKNPDVVLPTVVEETVPVWHVFAVRTEKRDELEAWLKEHGICTNKHYLIPIHLQECYKELGLEQGSLPIAEEISRTELSLPMYYGMTNIEVQYVINAINAF